MCTQRSNSVEIEIDSDVPRHLEGDPNRVFQILMNILSNACKFTFHGKISLHVSLAKSNAAEILPSERTRVKFCITDNGIGMAPEVVSQLFTPFSQGETQRETVREEEGGMLCITDMGVGVAPEVVSQLFTPF